MVHNRSDAIERDLTFAKRWHRRAGLDPHRVSHLAEKFWRRVGIAGSFNSTHQISIRSIRRGMRLSRSDRRARGSIGPAPIRARSFASLPTATWLHRLRRVARLERGARFPARRRRITAAFMAASRRRLRTQSSWFWETGLEFNIPPMGGRTGRHLRPLTLAMGWWRMVAQIVWMGSLLLTTSIAKISARIAF